MYIIKIRKDIIEGWSSFVFERPKRESFLLTSPTAAAGVSTRNSFSELNQFGDLSAMNLIDTRGNHPLTSRLRKRKKEERSKQKFRTKDEDQSMELC